MWSFVWCQVINISTFFSFYIGKCLNYNGKNFRGSIFRFKILEVNITEFVKNEAQKQSYKSFLALSFIQMYTVCGAVTATCNTCDMYIQLMSLSLPSTYVSFYFSYSSQGVRPLVGPYRPHSSESFLCIL
jgi:hypothetical protein